MARGVFYADIQTELFDRIENYLNREPPMIGCEDATSLVSDFEKWFADRSLPRRVFVPCVITRISAPRFEIGPVTFEFIDRITTSDFYPQGGENERYAQGAFNDLIKWMREGDAGWLARVLVNGCEQRRAEEVAELAVDLAIVAIHLAAPFLGTRTMTRLDARRGMPQKRTLSEAGGTYNPSWERKEPGMAIGQGTLPDILRRSATIFTAVGNVVSSYTSGLYRLPVLEQAWCDAAYWLYQVLTERIDSIAVAKLETALEILFRTESSAGSKVRLLKVLCAFFDLGPDDLIVPNSTLNANQFAKDVVRNRSRILHGTWSTLNARGIDRVGMEGFVITVLATAVLELEEYAQSANPIDDAEVFLNWVEAKNAKSAPLGVGAK
jgi:hypothetical protein